MATATYLISKKLKYYFQGNFFENNFDVINVVSTYRLLLDVAWQDLFSLSLSPSSLTFPIYTIEKRPITKIIQTAVNPITPDSGL